MKNGRKKIEKIFWRKKIKNKNDGRILRFYYLAPSVRGCLFLSEKL